MAPALLRPAALLPLLLLASSVARCQCQAQEEEAPASAPTGLPLAADSPESSALLSPISHPPTAGSPPIPSPDASPILAKAPSPSPAPAPSKESDGGKGGDDDDERKQAPAPAPGTQLNKDKEEDSSKSPAPAPSAEEVKASAAEQGSSDGPHEDEDMNGGKKAGVVVGAVTAAAVLGLGCFVWRKRRANIRRARYADYAARLELV